MNYRVGWPGWRLFARLGARLVVRVNVHFDAEVKSFWADSPDLRGLVVAAPTLEELRQEAACAAVELLDLAMPRNSHPEVAVRLRDELRAPCAA